MTEERRERKRKSLTEQVEESAKKKVNGPRIIGEEDLIPTGSTMLNLACSNNPFGGFSIGKITTLPGGSSSGKTLLILSSFAEINASERFDDYGLYYDDVEQALEFDIGYVFDRNLSSGVKPLEDRLLAPSYTKDKTPIFSDTIQDLKNNIFRLTNQGKPIIYCADSLDALTSDEELEKEYKLALQKAKSPEAVQELKGSYKTEKAKIIGETLRMIKARLAETRSAMIIVQQLRQKIGLSFGKKTTTSGGNAPYFYSTHQIWTTRIKTYNDTTYKDRKIGTRVEAEVVKNKLTGAERTVFFDAYNDYGIDDVGSCIEFILSVKHWKPMPGKERIFDAAELEISGDRFQLVEQVEKKGLERRLKIVAGEVWNRIEDSLRTDRIRRFGS